MANVGLNPTPNINLQALFDPIKEQCPVIRHLRSVECRNKSATYKMVPNFYVLMKVLRRKVGVLSSDNVLLGAPSTNFITDFFHIGWLNEYGQLIGPMWIILQIEYLVDRARIISYLLPLYKHYRGWGVFRYVRIELANYSHGGDLWVFAKILPTPALNDPIEIFYPRVLYIYVKAPFLQPRSVSNLVIEPSLHLCRDKPHFVIFRGGWSSRSLTYNRFLRHFSPIFFSLKQKFSFKFMDTTPKLNFWQNIPFFS